MNNMTPIEKANELYSKYDDLLNKDFGNPIVFDNQLKQCALIAVDQILNELDELLELPEQQQDSVYRSWLYYKEVKEEIENL
jgi:hypothetical protein